MATLDRRALGKRLTALANASALELAALAPRDPGKPVAKRIGVTGPPGAGKSTLLGLLALDRAPRGRTGILAIDPSSPKSGGAILGDRIRIDSLPGTAEIYVRSLASRNTSDGLADNLPEMLELMDELDFAEVFLETVGVGQAEHAARLQVDTLVLVLLPGSGDMVQAMKAGIAELADIFVINKCDLPGAEKMANDIVRMASFQRFARADRKPPVLLVSSTKPDTISALSLAIDEHQAWFARDGRPERRQRQRAHYRLMRLLESRVAGVLAQQEAAFFDQPLTVQMARTLDILRAQDGRDERRPESPQERTQTDGR